MNTIGEQHDRDDNVDHRPAGHHDQLLPPRLAVEEPVEVLVVHVLVLGIAGIGDQLREQARVGLRTSCGSASFAGGSMPTSLT